MAAQSGSNYESVADFYGNRDVFITGGTGFVGKVLIEKLLRSCPDLGYVFVLMRNKRGKTIESRVEELVGCPLFDRLRKENSDALSKVVPVYGDITQLRLGMYAEDIQRLSNVSVAFHLAASVRFDDPLKDAIKNNICSTQEMFELLKSTATRLSAVVHVSTAYSNPENHYVEEKLYPPKYDWKKLVQAADRYEQSTLDALMKKLSHNSPNTYTYTKGLAEQVCNDYRSELPLVIVRPSVVLFTIEEPMSGWVDNFNGPTGMLVSAGLGITRTAYLRPKNRINIIPVDVVAKTIILAAWKRATIDKRSSLPDPLPIYNSAVSYEQSLEYQEMLERGKQYLYEVPFSRTIWVPRGAPTDWIALYYFKLYLTMILPSLLLDLLIRVLGHKPFLMRLQSRIYGSEIALRYFVTNEWEFETKQTNNLLTFLDKKDRKTFGWYMPRSLTGTYMENAYIPIRRYLLKDSDETIPYAKRKLARMILIDRIIQLIVCCLMVVVIYRTTFAESS